MSAKWLFTFKHFKFPLLPLLTHSALLTIAPVFWETIEKPSMSMVNLGKNIQW